MAQLNVLFKKFLRASEQWQGGGLEGEGDSLLSMVPDTVLDARTQGS